MVEAASEKDDIGAAFERRAYPRFDVALAGACSVAGRPDIACATVDMSMGGAALRVEAEAVAGDAVTLALPQIGLVRGRVARVFDGGIAVAFDQTRLQRERLAGYLTWLVARRLDSDLEDRGSERIVPLRRIVAITVGCVSTTARIVDVSRSGVALTATRNIAVGDDVLVGSTPAVVVRTFPAGFAARFVEALDADLDVTIVL